MGRKMLMLVLLICASGASCAGADGPQVSRIQVFPYRAEEHGNFVEIALDRAFDRNERYDYRLELLTKDARVLKCEGVLANPMLAPPARTFRENLFLSCVKKRSPDTQKYDFETVEFHVGPGKVQSVLVVLGTYSTSFKFTEIGRWTIGPL